MSKLNINYTYLRDDTDFSLGIKDEEKNIEYDKCNYYTNKKIDTTPLYITQTYSVVDFKTTISNMIVSKEQNISDTRGNGVSTHYIIDEDGSIYQMVPDNKRPWATGVGELQYGSILNQQSKNIKNNMNDFGISIIDLLHNLRN